MQSLTLQIWETDHAQQFSNICILGSAQELAHLPPKKNTFQREAWTEREHAKNHTQFWRARQSMSFKKYISANLGGLLLLARH